jgi:chromosomal replication initiator protein
MTAPRLNFFSANTGDSQSVCTPVDCERCVIQNAKNCIENVPVDFACLAVGILFLCSKTSPSYLSIQGRMDEGNNRRYSRKKLSRFLLKDCSIVSPQDAWNATYNQLELQLDRASFDTWLRSAVFLGVENGVYVIGVQNSYAQDMLQHRLYRNVRRVLSDVCGKTTEIRFDVVKAKVNQAANEELDAPLFRFMQQQQSLPALPETQEFNGFGHANHPDYELNPRYTFDRFIVNKSNQVVYEAALAVAEYPSTLYNPFVIYGGVGLGKTHLLQSIANVCKTRGMRTVYIPSEVFTNDLVNAIRNRTTAMFRDKYRSIDVLLVDDIQFIGGKDTTQEEFFHTFNALVNFNKQIVLVSDRHPRELKTLEDRLRSRFQGGLVADIQAPEYETRLAIMKMWAQERGTNLRSEVIETLALRAPNNVRELEGVFNQIIAQNRFMGEMSLPKVEHTLERFSQPRERISMNDIISTVAESFGFTADELKGSKRTARINKARQVAMYLCREMTEASLPSIGDYLGGRSHTTVLHGINKMEEELETDRVMEQRLLKIRKTLNGARK